MEPDEQFPLSKEDPEHKVDDLPSAISTGKVGQTGEANGKIAHSNPTVIDRRPPSPNLANIGKKASRDEDPKKDVPRQKAEKVVETLDVSKEQIPDVAPPPYSVDVNEAVPLSSAPNVEPFVHEKTSTPAAIHSHQGSKQKSHSWFYRVCNMK